MPVNPNELINVEEAKLEAHDPWVTINSRNELYFNPLAMATFDKTVVTPTAAVGFKKLSEKEVAVYFTVPGERAVPFKRSPNLRTGRCSFAPITVERPLLRPPKGRQFRFPFRLDTPMGGTPIFVLIVGNRNRAYPTRTYTRKATTDAKTNKQPAANQAPSEMTDDAPETDA